MREPRSQEHRREVIAMESSNSQHIMIKQATMEYGGRGVVTIMSQRRSL